MVRETMMTTMKKTPPRKIPAMTQQVERGRRSKHGEGSEELKIVVSLVNSVRLLLRVPKDWSVLVLLWVGENVAQRMKVVSGSTALIKMCVKLCRFK